MAAPSLDKKLLKMNIVFDYKIKYMETNFTYWGTFLKKLRQFELSVLKILSVYYFLCGLYPWIMLLVIGFVHVGQ